MSFRFGKVSIIAREGDQICSECGRKVECRPYGSKGALVCYDCGEKTPERTEHNMRINLFGEKGDLQ